MLTVLQNLEVSCLTSAMTLGSTQGVWKTYYILPQEVSRGMVWPTTPTQTLRRK